MSATHRQRALTMPLPFASRHLAAPACVLLCAAAGCHAGPGDGRSAGAPPAPDERAARQAAAEPRVAPTPGAEVPVEAQAEPWIRVAWTRDVGDGADVLSFGDQLTLMALDSRDGAGERTVLDRPASYARPLVTPSGTEIVFSIRHEGAVYAIGWDGAGLRRIADGFGLAVWTDPDSGTEWVYVGADEVRSDPPAYRAVRRYRLAAPGPGEPVWNGQRISADSFQLSADGRYAGGLFPWPAAGVADLRNGTLEVLGEGCWTALASDDSRIFWYFDGLHRNVTMVDVDTGERWQVNVNGAPGIDGFEVWHPRWTNDPRHLVLTGPYTVGGRANRIRGGGDQVEIFVGRFSADLRRVEHWRQVTDNRAPDFYPDAWIAPESRAAPPVLHARSAAPAADPAPSAAAGRLVVDARVVQEVAVPTPRSIAPYRHGLLAIEYEVEAVIEGTYDDARLVAAHWVIRDGAVLDDARRAAGDALRMTLEPYDARPELEGQRLVMETTAFTLPLYYDTGSAP